MIKAIECVVKRKLLIEFPLHFVLFADKQANGRMPLLQEPLFGARPQPYSEYMYNIFYLKSFLSYALQDYKKYFLKFETNTLLYVVS